MTDLRDVERRLVAVVRQAAGLLPQDKLAGVESLADHGEPGVALELFCDHFDDLEVAAPEAMAHELAEIAAMMKMTLPPWIGDPNWAPPTKDH